MRTKEIQAMIKEGLFKPNVELSRKEVERLTKRARPSATFPRKTVKAQFASNLLLTEFQTSVNKQLHEKGLHLRSVDYSTSFRVLPRKETAAVVNSYFNRSANAADSGNTLELGRAKRK